MGGRTVSMASLLTLKDIDNAPFSGFPFVIPSSDHFLNHRIELVIIYLRSTGPNKWIDRRRFDWLRSY